MQTLIPVINHSVSKQGQAVDAFVRLVNQGIEAWNEAGKKLVMNMEKDANFFDKVRKAHPEISKDMLVVFERIGRKQIYAPLLADSSIGARALMEMPYAIQEKFAKAQVEVVTNYRTGATKRASISELSRSEVKQVLDTAFGEIISPESQISELRAKYETRAAPTEPAAAQPKRVEKLGCFTVHLEGGKIVLIPTKETFRAQQVRLERLPKGGVADILLYFQL